MIRKYFRETYRPLFHYSAQSNIINDPNGLVWYAGEYHLFHQYNVNNHIHWGHAVSTDLIHWKHLRPALFPDSIGQIWSGSVVVDFRNSMGLQNGSEPILAALFTYNEHVDAEQSQGLAYSSDRGRTWTMYDQNPVLTGRGKKDFRDPKVFWDEARNRWAMVLACGDHVEFYASVNLKEWNFTGSFGKRIWAGSWECPDLFELPIVNESGKSAWVLVTSMNNGAPAGGTGMRYFVGQFDGERFSPCHEDSPWLDMGKDFYAGVTWNHIPQIDGRRLMIAWADNWRYRDHLPTEPFLGQFSCIRELTLVRDMDNLRLVQQPNRELVCLRRQHWHYSELTVSSSVALTDVRGEALDITMRIQGSLNSTFLLKLWSGSKCATIGFRFKDRTIFVDRRGSSTLPLPDYQERYEATLLEQLGSLDLRILLDRSQVEVFADEGRTVLTNLLFPENDAYTIELYAESGEILVELADIYQLDTIWTDEAALYGKMSFQPVFGQWAHSIFGIEGWCKETGIALLPDTINSRHWSMNLKITEYETGAVAGLILDYQTNIIVFLNGVEDELAFACDGKILDRIKTKVNRGRVYKLEVQADEKTISVLFDDVLRLCVPCNLPQNAIPGLYVVNSFAYFIP